MLRSLLSRRLIAKIPRFFGQSDRISEDFIKSMIGKEKKIKEEAEFLNRGETVEYSAKERHPIKRAHNEIDKQAIFENPPNEEEKTKKKLQKDQTINFEPIKLASEPGRLIETQYGVLKVPDRFEISKLSNLYFLVNSSNINYVMKVLNNDSKGLLLFPYVSSALLDCL